MTAEPLYLRGALVAYSPDATSLTDRLAYIPFRFNPESISRSFAAVQGVQPTPADGGKNSETPTSGKEVTQATAPIGLFKESFSLKLRFDVHEREQSLSLLPPDLGIAPELAALEMLMEPVGRNAIRRANAANEAKPLFPTLLFAWGPRVMPVRLVSLRIDETSYNAFLNPVRAEAEASFEVVPGNSDQDKLIQGVHSAMAIRRRALASRFLANTAAQGGGLLPL